MRQSSIATLLVVALLSPASRVAGQVISGPAYSMINQRAAAVQSAFYVYLDADSGYNHGFASGFFASPGNLGTIHLDVACIDDPNDPAAVHGCTPPGSSILDRQRGTVMRVTFDPQTPGNFAGINIEEPENWGVLRTGTGYDLSGTVNVVFDVRSPDGATLQFGVGGCNTAYTPIPVTWTTLTVPLDSLSCIPDLSNVHILFAIAANDLYTSGGGTALLDNIQFVPVLTSQQTALGFPFANQTFGVVPLQNNAPGRVPIPADQLLRNVAPIYESSLVELLLLGRGRSEDITNARLIADTLDYALRHDNHGDSLPLAPDGSAGLHNAFEDGVVSFLNDQAPPKLGKAGDTRLSGFTAGTGLCGPSGFCLVLDGATGGNNAFAILALVAAYRQFGDSRYLDDARTIGNWIVGNLTDTTGTGYGGYYLGYPDQGEMPKVLIMGKSIENNADIFAAFTALASIEAVAQKAAKWTADANVAGDFVMQMFDSVSGSFFAGTVLVGSPPDPAAGNCQTPYISRGNDVVNTCDFLDANTFTTLALASAPRYRHMIDWRRPVQHVLDNFAQSVTAAGQTFSGFDIVMSPSAGPNGIAWEFTGQAVESMWFVDRLYGETRFEALAAQYLAQIHQAQIGAPFADAQGLVASTLQGGDTLAPIDQCLSTPFQCIAERVGLAATAWAIAAELHLNPFGPLEPSRGKTS